MRRLWPLLVLLFLSMSSGEISESDIPPQMHQKMRAVFHHIPEKAFYFGAGMALESAALLTRLGGALCSISPWNATIGKECLLLSHLCDSAARHVFAQMFKGSLFLPKEIPSSQSSWHLNQRLISQTPAHSDEEKKLLLFLEKRWLAKSNGFFSFIVDWICPCFGIFMQVDPATTSSYSRNPFSKFSETYKNRIEEWKKNLPHPHHFPLILTRPFSLQDYLPSYTTTAERMQIIDLTSVLPIDTKDRDEWLAVWKEHQSAFSQFLCIQRVEQEGIGGIRLLPLSNLSREEIELQHQYLLEWIGCFGLSANRVELDRCPLSSNAFIERQCAPSTSIEFLAKEEFVSYLNSFEKSWKSEHPQKTLLLKATLQLLKGLFAALSEDKWNEIIHCATRSAIAQFSLTQIKEQFTLLAHEGAKILFFDTASHIEQIHSHLSSLLEIFSPFTTDDFPSAYRTALVCIPKSLQPLTSCGVHVCGMTSLAGIFKAVEKALGTPPRVLYGENTYYECIHAAKKVSNASAIDEATEEDWKEVDLLLAQFNPVLIRVDTPIEYRIEKVRETLHKSLNAKREKPLTLALDCTFDFINSPRVAQLLEEFQEEVQKGALNIICYRSGLKFDLFGMDNYCGAPFYMIHSRDAKWKPFDLLSTDPVLQTDRLSLNWFCLAYQSAALYLDQYRKQIFDNTRSLLNKVPSSLLNNKNTHYQIPPFDQEAEPAFIEIKTFGSFHSFRAAALVGGSLYMKCMEGGHPIFTRPSLGFYHPNFSILFGEKSSSVRLTLGLDPAQVDLLAACFEKIDAFNGNHFEEGINGDAGKGLDF